MIFPCTSLLSGVQNVLEVSIFPVVEYTLVQESHGYLKRRFSRPQIWTPMDSAQTDKGMRVFSTFRDQFPIVEPFSAMSKTYWSFRSHLWASIH